MNLCTKAIGIRITPIVKFREREWKVIENSHPSVYFLSKKEHQGGRNM